MPGYQQYIKYVLIGEGQGDGEFNLSGSILLLFCGGGLYFSGARPDMVGKKQLYLSHCLAFKSSAMDF